jgi:hypothetical protein
LLAFFLQLFALMDRFLDARLTVLGRVFSRRALSLRQFVGIAQGQLLEGLDLQPRVFQKLLEPARAAERTLAGVGPDFHAVLGDSLHGDQIFGHECGDDLGEELVPLVTPLGAEVGEHVVVDGDAAAEPLIRQMVFAESFQFTRAANAFQGGEHPERDEQAGIGGIATDVMLDRLDFEEPGIEVELADEAPDDACLGIGIESFVEGGPVHFDLIAVRDAKPRRSSSGILGGLGGPGLGEIIGLERERVHSGTSRACVYAREAADHSQCTELYYEYSLFTRGGFE